MTMTQDFINRLSQLEARVASLSAKYQSLILILLA